MKMMRTKKKDYSPIWGIVFFLRKEKNKNMKKKKTAEAIKASRAYEIGRLMGAKEFFTSKVLREELEREIYIMLSKFSTKKDYFKVELSYSPSSEYTASTDGKRVKINAGHKLFRDSKRWMHTLKVKGACVHETGHLLYTSFDAKKEQIKGFKENLFIYPPEDDVEGAEELISFVNEGEYQNTFIRFWGIIDNRLEDGYEETRLKDDFDSSSRFVVALKTLRKGVLKATPKLSKEEEVEGESDEERMARLFPDILNLLLIYATTGVINCKKKLYNDERVQAIVKCIPYIDTVNYCCYKKEEHAIAKNNVMAVLSQYFIAYCKSFDKDEDAEKHLEDKIPDVLKMLSSDSDCDGEPMAEIPDDMEFPEPSDEEYDKDYSEKCSDGEEGEKSLELTDEEVEKITEETEKTLQEISTEKAERELEEEHKKELIDFDKSIEYDKIHKNIRCHIERQLDISEAMKKSYEAISEEPLKVSKRINKLYLKELAELSQDDVMHGLRTGQTFDAVSVCRKDKKWFSTTREASETTMSVGLLVDQSGSMCDSGRIEAARIAAIILDDFCRNCGIRSCIMGHDARFSDGVVRLHSYTDFDSYDKNDKYRLVGIRALEDNRDGYALKYMAERLKKEESDVKLLIIISDGAPWAMCPDHYAGKKAVEDMRKVCVDCKRDNIIVCAAAIGSDKETIKSIYGESNFLDISNLATLPQSLIGLIKRYLPT